jgi:outer membrane lipoprotein-sorting protein
LVDQLNHDGASISALKGKLSMGLQRTPDDGVRRCSGMIFAAKEPDGGVHLKAYKRLLPTFFTLVSDGKDFWFYIPRDDLVYTGSVDSSWSHEDSLEFYLDANDVSRALFVSPVDAAGDFVVQDRESNYELTVYAQGAVARRLWIERKRFTVVREVHYDEGGIEQLEILRSEYVDLEGRLYPASFVLHDLVSGARVFFDFGSIALEPENIPEDAFRFRVPDGAEVKQVTKERTRT